jgi:broad specificity phosphatase PhoE
MTLKASAVYNAYPLSQLSELQKKHPNVKTIHIIRHAEGTHNVHKQYKAEINLDARLTDKGVAQCEALAASQDITSNVDLVVTSTLTRCIQTALTSFPGLAIPFVAHESIRETINHTCDRRRLISQISQEFPHVDFSHVEEEEDEIWNDYTTRMGPEYDSCFESAELWKVAERGRDFLGWLSQRGEQNVILCTHSAFLRCVLSWGQDGGVEFIMDQTLDNRQDPGPDEPVIKYCGDEDFERHVRADYENCELRSFVIVFDE